MQCFAGADDTVWLDSSASEPGAVSRLAVRPLATLTQSGAVATLSAGGRVLASASDAWQLWRDAHERLRLPAASAAAVGWYGYIGFEMARRLERVTGPPLDERLPQLRLMLCDAVIVLDHRRNSAVLHTAPAVRARLGLPPLTVDDVIARWTGAAVAGPIAAAAPDPPQVSPCVSRADYLAAVRRVIDYIAAGDIYQANYAQCFDVRAAGDPWAIYARLRWANPALYGALLKWDDAAVLSASPELFLSVRGRAVRSRPIKGTRPRIGDAVIDAAARAALLASEKDAAELAMIVDLHRNDLGRVCRPGSIHVSVARELEEHPTVYHTVAEIAGELAAGRDALDLLRAAFPAGSISGVPKVRALEIIGALEPRARGVFTGAVGWLGLGGDLDMNVAIRTLQLRGGCGTLWAGGGIVADSDPAEEYEETLAKVAGVLAGLGVATGRDALRV